MTTMVWMSKGMAALSTPEWGEAGVHPLSVVAATWNLDLGDWPQSDMTGIVFRYRDVVSKLRKSWVLSTDSP
jgi:hypothetical protein